ncbi:MAG: SpoIIE family protein phosphatase, partial [Clostridia bacterium]|nr:SpoIIE family protein phosphatase [Clostridia bacterium]
PKFDIQTAAAQHNCRGGKFCGNSFNYFRDGQGRFIVIISDGMGTGGRAAVDGGMAVSVMTKLIRSGLGFDASLSAANSALMVKSNDESLATADIFSINLFSGESEIMKAGAPVTFVRKGGKVIRIEPTSLPAGILPDVRLTHDEMTLGDGDIVIMVSDGAIAISDEWIGAMLRDFEGDDIHELVNDIIDEATIGSSLGRDDDITVLGLSVFENA